MTRFALVFALCAALFALACEDGPSDADVALCKRYCDLQYKCGDPVASQNAALSLRADGDQDGELELEAEIVEMEQVDSDTEGESETEAEGDTDGDLDAGESDGSESDAPSESDTESDGDSDAEPDAEANTSEDGDVDDSAEADNSAKGDAVRREACHNDCDSMKDGNFAPYQPLMNCGHSNTCDEFTACASEAFGEDTSEDTTTTEE